MSEALSVPEAVSALESLLDDDGFIPEEVSEEVEEDTEEELEDESEEEDKSDNDSDEEESEDDDDAEEEETEDKLFEIEVDGELYEVNEEELRSGYLRNEQLVKRQQELESQYSEKLAETEQYQQRLIEELELAAVENASELQRYRNLDWERLKNDDPDLYKDTRLRYIELQEAVQSKQAKRNQVLALHQQAQEIKHQAYLKTQQELAARLIPELNDEGFVDSVLNYGKQIGFSEDEMRGIADARVLFLLNQARLYANSQIKRKEAKEKMPKELPKVVKPGTPRSPSQEGNRKTRELQSKLSKTHDMRTAAALLEQFI